MQNALFVSVCLVSAYVGNEVIVHSIIGKGFSYSRHIYIYIYIYIWYSKTTPAGATEETTG